MSGFRLPSMTGLFWFARRSAWYLGWVPMLASSVLIVVWLYLLQQQPAKTAQLASLEQEVEQLELRSATPVETGTPISKKVAAAKTPEVESEPVTLSELWQQLPASSELSPRMLQVAALAQKHHIPLNVGDYQWQAHQAAVGPQLIQQFDMRFTIQSDYITCRRFISEVLRRYPTMALTGLELRKNETVQPVIETTLTFSMFIRGGHEHAT
ncbi:MULTISPECIES: hypothetical protein [unclassified Methylophilus]|uniref:hypothetical protein n=1 Tax=unclassified Methylophilus TaxID=2630143 RepID=UPI0006F39798|nr:MULTISPECIES: hypothetical protein [unclassified Methylophilus]KQT41837.1 hypothetical protein ASG34_09765 [Methylophilus sp. Leaf416]KQT56002.1 hypothetical protein ASG44_11295 [Methylophilus sp. Leaf459]